MSIVNETSLERAKILRKEALISTDWRHGYDYAIRGLELAIAMLEQIKDSTKDLTVKTSMTITKEE